MTIEQRRDQEVVVCYEAATGKEVWTAGVEGTRFDERLGGPGPRATPTIAHGDVFALGAEGRLVCLDGKDGKEKWAVADAGGQQEHRVGDERLAAGRRRSGDRQPRGPNRGGDGQAVRAYDRTSGKPVWAAGNHQAGYVSPQLATLGGKKQVLIFDADGLGGHDLARGPELWRFPWPT